MIHPIVSPIPASFLRRCGAICYDLLILVAILMISTWILMPFTQGNAINPGTFVYQLYLLIIAGGYYAGFWVYSGQTVGMKAWRIQVQTLTGAPLTWSEALKRLLWASITLLPLGIGLLVALFHPNHQTLYDILAKTQVTYLQNSQKI